MDAGEGTLKPQTQQNRFAPHVALEDQLQLIFRALQHLGDGVLITEGELDYPGPKIVYANEAMCRISGYRAEELIGKTPRFLQGPETSARVRREIRETLQAGRDLRTEIVNYTRHGLPYLVELFITPLRDVTGRTTHFVSIQRDVTTLRQAQAERDENRSTFNATLAAMTEAVFVCDADGNLVDFNHAFLIFHRIADGSDCPRTLEAFFEHLDVRGMPRDELLPLSQWGIYDALRGRTLIDVEYSLRRRETGEQWIGSYNFSPIRSSEGEILGAVGVARDVTERNQLDVLRRESQLRLQAEADALARLDNATARLWQIRDLQRGLDEILNATITMVRADKGCVQLLDPSGHFLIIAAERGLGREFSEFFRKVTVDNDSACGRAFRHQRRSVIEDIQEDSKYVPFLDIAHKASYRAVQSTPLIGADGKTLGIISTHWNEPYCLAEQDMYRLDLYARQAAGFIERCRFDELIEDRELRLRAILDTVPDSIITINRRGFIEQVNQATERKFGYPAQLLIGENISMLMPDALRQVHDQYLERVERLKTSKVLGVSRELVAEKRDGTRFPVRISVGQIDHLGLFTGVIEDISERVELQRQILLAAAEESRRIGQELHDNLQQQLTGLGLLAQTLADGLTQEGIPQSSLARRLAEGIDTATHQTHQLARGLIPVDIEANGLEAALADLARNITELYGIACIFRSSGEVSLKDNATATHLYRITQEAINNAVKHAEATEIRITLEARGRKVELEISDNGKGLPEDQEQSTGFGLKIMRYRASMIGAHLHVTGDRSRGTSVFCEVPL